MVKTTPLVVRTPSLLLLGLKMSHAPQSLRDVILLVDASSSLSGICQSLINEYVLPCLE